jgi:hypothetical protein
LVPKTKAKLKKRRKGEKDQGLLSIEAVPVHSSKVA